MPGSAAPWRGRGAQHAVPALRALEERPGTVAGGRACGQVRGCSGTARCRGGDAGGAQPRCLPGEHPQGWQLPALWDLIPPPPPPRRELVPCGAVGDWVPPLPPAVGLGELPPPPHPWAEPISPLPGWGLLQGRGSGAARRLPCQRGGPAGCMSVAVAFVCGLSVRVCPSVRVSISQEIKLCTPSLAAWGGGTGGAAAHLCLCTPTGPPTPNINFLFLWFGTNGAGPAQLPPPTPSCRGTGSDPRPPTVGSSPCAPQSLPVLPSPRLRARWCRWRGCGRPLPCRGPGSHGGPRAPMGGARRASGGGPGWAPRPGAGCRARTAHGARGSS